MSEVGIPDWNARLCVIGISLVPNSADRLRFLFLMDPTLLFALVLPLFPGNGFGANLIRTDGTDNATGRLAADFANLLVLFGFHRDQRLDLTLGIVDIPTPFIRADCEMRGRLHGNTNDLH